MATWGDFIKDINVVKMQRGMYVKVDEVIALWEERNALRAGIAPPPPPQPEGASEEQLKEAVTAERDACARDVDEFAEACAAEADIPEAVAAYLRAAAQLIRDKGQEVPEAMPIEEAEVTEDQPPSDE